jgi:hypothetical protein
MSKFSDRAEQFYMEQFKDMFKQEKDKEKAQKQLRKKLSKVNDEVIFEDVLSTIAEIAEKNSDVFNGTRFAKKTKKIINEAFGDEEEEIDMEDDVPESTDPDDEPMENEEDEIPEPEIQPGQTGPGGEPPLPGEAPPGGLPGLDMGGAMPPPPPGGMPSAKRAHGRDSALR